MRNNYAYIYILIVLIIVFLFLPYGAKFLFHYNPYQGLDPDNSRTVLLTISTLQLPGILSLVGIIVQLHAQRLRDQHDAYQKLVESANAIAELPLKYEKFYDCLESLYVAKIPADARPSESLKNGILYIYHLGIVCNIF